MYACMCAWLLQGLDNEIYIMTERAALNLSYQVRLGGPQLDTRTRALRLRMGMLAACDGPGRGSHWLKRKPLLTLMCV